MVKPSALPFFKHYSDQEHFISPKNSKHYPKRPKLRPSSSVNSTLRRSRSRSQCSLLTCFYGMRQKLSLKMPTLLLIGILICVRGILLCHAAADPVPEPKGTIPAYGKRAGLPRIVGVADKPIFANLTRQHGGDLFYTFENEKCDTDTCVGLSSGTASVFTGGGGNDVHNNRENDASLGSKVECKCQCLPHLTTYREDLGICVDDVRECTLAPFISGSTTEKIPFVFLPHRGQIVYPSKEIGFPGVKMPMCAVSGSQFLTHTGWTELRNPIDTDVPFRLFRDEGRIYLQWLGEPDLRQRMQGRLILVHLMCRDMTPRLVLKDGRTRPLDDLNPNQNIFTPCIAFRVVGTPIKYVNNVTEVSFSSENHHIDSESGLSTKEYIVIAICSLCLGLIYIASVFLYIHMKKRKRNTDDDDANTIKNDYSSYQQNDQVTFGVGLGSQVGPFGGQARKNSFIGRSGSQRTTHRGISTALNVGLHAEEMGIVKNNPLLKHFPNLSDNSGFISDNSNSASEFEDERTADAEKKMQTTANVHQSKNYSGHTDMDGGHHHPPQGQYSNQQQMGHHSPEAMNNPNSDTECLPEENVSIVEDVSNDEKLHSMKSIVNGTMRRKLYFNPAYFEPHLLVSPPPAAVEFLNKIREVITIAKYKMSTKRFQPSLNIIPEELQHAQGSETYAAAQTASPSRRSSLISSRKDSSKKSACSGCPGCDKKGGGSDVVVPSSNCKNCGDKQNSIRKWLEEVSSTQEEPINEDEIMDDNKSPVLSSEESVELLKEMDEQKASESMPISPEVKKVPKALRSHHGNVQSDSSSASDNETIVAGSAKERSSIVRTPSKDKSIRSDSSSTPKIVSHSLKNETVKMTQFGSEDRSLMKNNNFEYDLMPSDDRAYDQEIPERNLNNSRANAGADKIYEKNEIYNITGSELYNNPQFDLSPKMQHRSLDISNRHHHHQHGRKRSQSRVGLSGGKKQIEVYDQFANVTPTRMRNFSHMPDMVYEALAMDQRQNSWTSNPESIPVGEFLNESCNSRFSSIDRTDKYKNEKFFHDFINSDDNNTLGNRSGKNSFNKYQPDSPIYSRKSPHYLIVDYETDSLERVTSKTHANFNTSTTTSSDLSSQPSPSNSTALPLEEEVEIRNAIYDRVEGFRKDTDTIKKERELSSIDPEEYEDVPMNSLAETVIQVPTKKGPKIKADTPFQGSITIEVEHSPDECDLSTDSDQFEPDTLDRKPKKHNNIVGKHKTNVWGQNNEKETNRLSSSTDLNNATVLKNSNSFKETSFGSLREIYESKNLKNVNIEQIRNLDDLELKSGKLLTLELRHSKRQRTNDNTAIAPKLIPPDLIPPENSVLRNLYDQPRQQLRKVEDYGIALKNLACWNNDKFTKQPNGPAPKPTFCKLENYESTKSFTPDSESTQYTALSDTDNNSSKKQKKISNYSQVNKAGRDRSQSTEKEGFRLVESSNDLSALENYMTLSEFSEKNFLDMVDTRMNQDSRGKTQNNSRTKFIEDIDKIEVLSTKTLSSCEYATGKSTPNINPKEGEESRPSFEVTPITTTKVFRVEINQATNGMQIAMGLRDRVKKSKDIKNAWKKFIGIATSKFNAKLGENKNDSDLEKNSESSDILDKDEGISSLIDDASTAYDSSEKKHLHHHKRHHHHISSPSGPSSSCRQISIVRRNSRPSAKDDSGYISADSNEFRRHNKKLYERFNFPSNSTDSSDPIQEENKYEICTIPENSVNTARSNTSSSSDSSARSDKQLARPRGPPPPLPPPNPPPLPPTATIPSKQQHSTPPRMIEKPPPPPVVNSSPQVPRPQENFLFNTADSISVHVYSSDDENIASSDNASCITDDNNDDDDDGTSCATDDHCESGAESVETNSVFFKNIRPRLVEACNLITIAH
ncbi:uncharacterized protein LOC129764862 [Toxorhynchites rutilus septentrionalis]|uniref:uncharacterized protein LOC129764862 n=1 Tax=Toxorhynchites rutilus septentrionalis TaxID=329112 RepID=UPI0024795E49|nr:uncharacterized protein LOC129764862 [Toxorhynchites rutilus septentrionalis]